MHLSRRRFIQLSALTGASFYLGFPRFPAFAAAPRGAFPDSPLAELSGAFASTEFNGDDVRRPHNILWDVEGYIRKKGGRPTTFRQESVVVIGGGMAGLISAYHLRDLKPVVLEQAARFGGNSKGERYQGSAYSIGAAYVTVPDEGSSVDTFFRETGVDKMWRHEKAADTRVSFHGVKDLWSGGTDPAAHAAAVRDKTLRRLPSNHSPQFAPVIHPTLETGVRAMTAAAGAWLGGDRDKA